MLQYVQWDTTPAKRLQLSGYFTTNTGSAVLNAADSVWRSAVAKGYNPMYDSAYVVSLKAQFVQTVQRLRRQNPAFDAEIRRALIGVSTKHGPLSTVDGLLRLYFGAAYGETEVAKELNK